jgi:selenocysteine lyase/cysteine desulfurase
MPLPIDFTQQFPVLSTCTYLNTASSGLLAKKLVKWRGEHDQEFLDKGSLFRDAHKEYLKEIKQRLGRFFNTNADRIALVPNLSFGVNTLLDGIKKGQKILLIEGDYPSINWPVEYRDFEICYAKLDGHLEQNIAEAFERFRPDIFMCSLVQYISGILIDFSFLKQIKKKYPHVIMLGDGTQYLGTARYNFEEGPFDIIGASSYKWMLSGYGNGFFMFKENVFHSIHPKTIGFNSADAVYGNKEKINLIGRMEPGHQDTLNYGTLGEAIVFLEEMGLEHIENKLNELSAYAFERFKQLEWLDPNILMRNKHSTIFNIKGDPKTFEKLKHQGVLTSFRGKGIRVSFHFYNSRRDIDTLIEVIQD